MQVNQIQMDNDNLNGNDNAFIQIKRIERNKLIFEGISMTIFSTYTRRNDCFCMFSSGAMCEKEKEREKSQFNPKKGMITCIQVFFFSIIINLELI